MRIDNDRDSKEKLLLSLFWTNRKAVRTEGCAPFLIEKIITEDVTYTPDLGKFLKLSNEILKDILKEIEARKSVGFEIKLGNESITISIQNNIFSVSTKGNRQLEEEIVEKLREEVKRGKPNICLSFPPRVGIHEIHK